MIFKKSVPTFAKSGYFHTWAHIKNNALVWSILIKNIDINDLQPWNYLPEWEREIPEIHHPP